MLPPYNKSSITTTNRHQHLPYGISLFSSYIFNYFHNKWIWTAALLFGLLIVNVNAIDELHLLDCHISWTASLMKTFPDLKSSYEPTITALFGTIIEYFKN
uniref:Uncharacterized protein n=1 Tax=Glossina pallidipes TaxID=7398 RepID=A0A1A9ZCN4_GLOPL